MKVLLSAGVVLRVFGFIVVGYFLTRAVLWVFTDINITDAEIFIEGMEDETKARQLLLLMQGLNAFFTFFFLPVLYLLFINRSLLSVFNFRTSRLPVLLILSAGIVFSSMPFISVLLDWNQSLTLPEQFSELQRQLATLEERAERLTKLMIFFDNYYEIIPIVLVVAILPAIGEELLFRGIVQNEFLNIFKNPHAAIWLTGILFSFIHFQFFGFVPRVALGVLFGYLYYWSGNLMVPITMHFINNAFTFVVMNYNRLRETETTMEDSPTSTAMTFIVTALCIMLLFAFRRVSGNDKTFGGT